jgi:hypothetical protein
MFAPLIALRSPKAYRTTIPNKATSLLLAFFLSNMVMIRFKKKGSPSLYFSLPIDYKEILGNLQANYDDIFPHAPKQVGKRITLTSKSLDYLNVLIPDRDKQHELDYQILCFMPFFSSLTFELWIDLINLEGRTTGTDPRI